MQASKHSSRGGAEAASVLVTSAAEDLTLADADPDGDIKLEDGRRAGALGTESISADAPTEIQSMAYFIRSAPHIPSGEPCKNICLS